MNLRLIGPGIELIPNLGPIEELMSIRANQIISGLEYDDEVIIFLCNNVDVVFILALENRYIEKITVSQLGDEILKIEGHSIDGILPLLFGGIIESWDSSNFGDDSNLQLLEKELLERY